MNRRPRNTAIMEVIANKNEIIEYLEKGATYTFIYKTFLKSNKITCKFNSFYKSVKKIILNENQQKYLPQKTVTNQNETNKSFRKDAKNLNELV